MEEPVGNAPLEEEIKTEDGRGEEEEEGGGESDEKKEQVQHSDSYLQRDDFSSERFKLEVRNLPKYFGYGEIRKFFKSLNLQYVKINSPTKRNFAFVTFVSEEAKQEAFKILNQAKFKGKQLEAIPAKPAADPAAALANNDAIRKRKISENQLDVDKKVKVQPEDTLTLEEKVQNSTTPLWKLSYEDQLIKKRIEVKQILSRIRKKIELINSDLRAWVIQQRKAHEGMCCELVDYIPSPAIDNYRNKCEFSIGYDRNEKNSMVGFRLGDYKSGSNEVVEPYACKNISDEVKNLAKDFQTYINEISLYKAFNVRTHDGHYRQLTVRTNQNKDLLAIIVFEKKNLTDDEIAAEKTKLIEHFNTNDKLVLLFSLNLKSCGIGKMDNLEKLFGNESCLYEQLFDLKFRISPLAFFQANTKAAEVLYSKIAEISNIDENTVVLDICCGTGTIGLTLAKRAKAVVGIEIIPEAIEDAILNSKLNNLTNVTFKCGKAEDVLPTIIRQYENEKVIAIVDPPRAGLHSKVIQTLRKLKNLDTLIYVSCNPELAINNFVDFARATSKNYLHEPFVPLKALAVDMFPHTSHYELILYLKRYKPEYVLNEKTNEVETTTNEST